MVSEHTPDLVLMDIQLPDLDGVQALHRLRATAHGDDPDRRLDRTGDARGPRAVPSGGLRRLRAKPVNVRDLIETVREHCDRWSR